jgi:Skp family chaperone for outer membrane proteins
MKIKVLFLLAVVFMLSISSHAQRGVRIGYIDTEYILENVPEYQEASAQLESKVQKWKTEIDGRLGEIEQKRKDLSNEKTLLTNELVKEREEDITFEELEILDYQQKRFGPNGDLMIQKRQLIQPIQDQIFAAVQDIASTKQYDFIFDKSADVVMLYSADRFDISEQVIRAIQRTSKREQAGSRKEAKEAKDEDVVPVVNEDLDERKKALEDKKAARAAEAAQRRQEILEEREAKKLASQKRRDSIIDARNSAREDRINEGNDTIDATEEETMPLEDAGERIAVDGEEETIAADDGEEETIVQDGEEEKTVNDAEEEEIKEDGVEKVLTDRERRQQELEERRQRILEERRLAKEARENKDVKNEEGGEVNLEAGEENPVEVGNEEEEDLD